jgi:hypothetical protein
VWCSSGGWWVGTIGICAVVDGEADVGQDDGRASPPLQAASHRKVHLSQLSYFYLPPIIRCSMLVHLLRRVVWPRTK